MHIHRCMYTHTKDYKDGFNLCVYICYGNSLCLRYIIETAAIRSSLHFPDQAAAADALVDIQ